MPLQVTFQIETSDVKDAIVIALEERAKYYYGCNGMYRMADQMQRASQSINDATAKAISNA